MHYILESIFMLFNSKNGANFIVGMIGPPHERITFSGEKQWQGINWLLYDVQISLEALFSTRKFSDFSTVALSLLFNN